MNISLKEHELENNELNINYRAEKAECSRLLPINSLQVVEPAFILDYRGWRSRCG